MFITITNILHTDNPFMLYKLYVIICYLLRIGHCQRIAERGITEVSMNIF